MEDLEGELWWPISKYDRYDISNFGRVRSWYYGSPRLISVNRLGCININHKGEKITIYVAREVLTAFLSPCPSDYHIAFHLDLDKRNNHIDNLVWLTRSEMGIIVNSVQIGPIKKIINEPFNERDRQIANLISDYSYQEISEILNIPKTDVNRTVRQLCYKYKNKRYKKGAIT